jgi:hypothetical protein
MGLAVVLAACSAHPRYVKGNQTQWVLPLIEADVGPELIVEGYIGNSGPHLFLVNPDVPFTSIDDSLAQDLGLFTRNEWRPLRSQQDRPVQARSYEIADLRLGSLEFERFGAMSFKSGAFDVRGQRIVGVLGGGVLTSTIVIEIDRDAGQLRLSRVGHQTIPPNSVEVRGRVDDDVLYVPAWVNGKGVELRVDLGRATSVWPHVAQALALPSVRVDETYVDPTGTAERRTEGATLAVLQLGTLQLEQETAVVFWEATWHEASQPADGILGRDILARYHVVIDRSSKRLWLAPRRASRPQ